MAIVKMARAQLLAMSTERDALLEALQEMGEVHFSDLSEQISEDDYAEVLRSDRSDLALQELSEELDLIELSIHGLSKYAPAPSGLQAFNNALPEMSYRESVEQGRKLKLADVADNVRANLRKIAKNIENIDLKREERKSLQPFTKLDVSLAQLDSLRSVFYALGSIPKRSEITFRRSIAESEESYLEVLGSDDKDLFFLLIYTNDDKTYIEEVLRTHSFSARSFNREKTAEQVSHDLYDEIKALEKENEELRDYLRAYAEEHLDSLKLRAEFLRNEKLKQEARNNFIAGEHVLLLELYFPLEKEEDLRANLTEVLKEPFALEVHAVERDDERVEEVPILLRNNALVTPFENSIKTFAVPKYNELDPTPLAMPWYCACFALMLGDLGYGLVMFILTTLALHAFKLNKETRSSMRFFQILSVPTIVVGILYGSFFALDIPKVSPLIGCLSPTGDTEGMLVFSLVFGLVMLFFGLGINGYMKLRDKDLIGFIADVLAWFLIVIGVIVLVLGDQIGLPESAKLPAKVALIIGALLVLFFSARDEKTWGGRLAWGLYNVYGGSSWLGDLVSYARLTALAMSGGFIGYAVNMIADMLFGSVGGNIAGLIILLIFHPFNLFLSVLSAYVHTLRLIYVELFGKFYEGGGKEFKRFRAKGEYIDIS